MATVAGLTLVGGEPSTRNST